MSKYYLGIIEYSKISSYMFNDSTLDKVSETMQQGLKFYKDNGEVIRNATIEAICDKCQNTGSYKVYKNKLVYKLVKCDCKKQYASEIITVNF